MPCEVCERCSCQGAARLRRERDEHQKTSERLRGERNQLQEDLDEETNTARRLLSERDTAVDELRRVQDLIAKGKPPSQRDTPKKTHRGKRAAKVPANA